MACLSFDDLGETGDGSRRSATSILRCAHRGLQGGNQTQEASRVGARNGERDAARKLALGGGFPGALRVRTSCQSEKQAAESRQVRARCLYWTESGDYTLSVRLRAALTPLSGAGGARLATAEAGPVPLRVLPR
jgi:hypothetical protein